MTKDEAEIKAKKIYEDWRQKRNKIEQESKRNGTWLKSGLDSNNYLFKEIDAEAKRKLELINSQIDD